MPYKIPTYDAWPLFIPDATSSAAGMMSPADKTKLDALQALTTVMVPLDAEIAAPLVTDVSLRGAATLALVVPAGMNHLFIEWQGPYFHGPETEAGKANLASGALEVRDGLGNLLTPSAAGLYTVTSGDTLSVLAIVLNVFSTSTAPKTAPTTLWNVMFQYTFSAV